MVLFRLVCDACRGGHRDRVRELIDSGANVNGGNPKFVRLAWLCELYNAVLFETRELCTAAMQ